MSLLNLLEEFVMFEKIRKMKNKKGFTLVELIVVLVILAILAALLIPALTGYIDKANKEKIISETRMVVMAAQTELEEIYAKGTANSNTAFAGDTIDDFTTGTGLAIKNLAEVKGDIQSVTYDAQGKISEVVYQNSGKTCTYTAANADPYSVS